MLCLCPTGLIDNEDWRLLALEGAVREYGAEYFRIYGLDRPPGRILDALDIVRATRNEIEARKFQRET